MRAILLFFGTLVLIVWAANSIQLPQFVPDYTRYQLQEVNFNFFSKSIKKNYISQGYGATYFALWSYIRPWHNGIDIVAGTGAKVHSPADGVVAYAGDQDKYCYKRAYGKFVAIKNNNDGKILLYAHLSKILVNKGDKIEAGDVIGLVGQSGQATAPHLHFSVFSAASFKLPVRNGCGPYPTGKDVNPIPYLESLNNQNSEAPRPHGRGFSLYGVPRSGTPHRKPYGL